MPCPFCSIKEDRIFYQNDHWFAFLAAEAHTAGHTILASRGKSSRCPQGLEDVEWNLFGNALNAISAALLQCYKSKNPKDILLGSLRGSLSHYHFHLIPLYADEEERWRKVRGHVKGHLFQFLGDLEDRGDRNNLKIMVEKNISKECLILNNINAMIPETIALKEAIAK